MRGNPLVVDGHHPSRDIMGTFEARGRRDYTPGIGFWISETVAAVNL